MEIQQLRHFIAAVRYGNIGRAAAELGISQSGISRSIRNLETVLGVALLVRSAHGVEPTSYGSALLPRAERILNEEQHAVEELSRIGHEKSGLLRIGVMTSYTNNLVPNIVFDLLREHPQLDAVLVSDEFGTLVDRLRVGQIDVLFGLLNSAVHFEEFRLRRLYTSQSDVVCPATHPLAAKVRPTIEDLSRASWVMPASVGFQQTFESFFQVRGQRPPRRVLISNSAPLLAQGLYSLNALTVMTREQSMAEVTAGQLVRLDCETPGGRIVAGILYRANTVVSPALRQLINMARLRTAPMREALPPGEDGLELNEASAAQTAAETRHTA